MRNALGLALILVGVGAGLYFGLWWAFIGGIVQIIEQVRAPELEALVITFGVVKIMFAGVIGWVVGLACVIPGAAMLK